MAGTKSNGVKAAVYLAYGTALALFLGTRFGKWSWFSYHVASMALSFVGLSSAAALVRKRLGYRNTVLHGQLMLVATALAAFGWYVIYSNKNMLGKRHLTSWHSWFGVAALVAYALLFVVGLAGLHPDFGLLKTNRFLKKAHNLSGKAAIAAGWTASVVAFNNLDNDRSHQALFAAPLLAGAFLVLL